MQRTALAFNILVGFGVIAVSGASLAALLELDAGAAQPSLVEGGGGATRPRRRRKTDDEG